MTKLFILQEIKRTAEGNGGRPLPQREFESQTGITRFDWFARFWARWSDAVREAGYGPAHAQTIAGPRVVKSFHPLRTRSAPLASRL
jgi:hypothetical protein